MQRNQSRLAALKAVEEDPTIFLYEEVYDAMQQIKEEEKTKWFLGFVLGNEANCPQQDGQYPKKEICYFWLRLRSSSLSKEKDQQGKQPQQKEKQKSQLGRRNIEIIW